MTSTYNYHFNVLNLSGTPVNIVMYDSTGANPTTEPVSAPPVDSTQSNPTTLTYFGYDKFKIYNDDASTGKRDFSELVTNGGNDDINYKDKWCSVGIDGKYIDTQGNDVAVSGSNNITMSTKHTWFWILLIALFVIVGVIIAVVAGRYGYKKYKEKKRNGYTSID